MTDPSALSSPDTTPELLPCPWCGKPAGVLKAAGVHQACCSNLDCHANDTYETHAEAVAAWNRRGAAQRRGLDPVTVEACAKVAENWHPSSDVADAIRALAPGNGAVEADDGSIKVTISGPIEKRDKIYAMQEATIRAASTAVLDPSTVEVCAKVADKVASDWQDDAHLAAKRDSYHRANVASNHRSGAEEVAREIRALTQPTEPSK